MLKSKHTFVLAADDKTKTTFNKVAKGINGVIKVAGAAGVAYVALTAKIVSATAKQQAALSQLEAGIKSTNGVVGRSVDELAAYAAELQKASIYGDEEIIAAQSKLLTFTKITGDQFDKTTQLALDLSARMGTDLTSSVVQLGKALNDPIANLSALSRSGIQFSDSQKAMIRSLIESGKMVEAQTIILAELETQFGGSARAARDDLGGAYKALLNAGGDLFEADSENADELAASLNELTDFLQDPATIQAVQEFTGAMLDGLRGVLKLAKETKGFIEFAAESMAAFTMGPMLEDIPRVEDEVEKLTRQIDVLQKKNERGFNSGRYTEQIQELQAELTKYQTALKNWEETGNVYGLRMKSNAEITEKATKATKDQVDATNGLNGATEGLINPFLKQQEQLSEQIKLFGKSKEETRLLNLEEQIRIEKAKMGADVTADQVIQFEAYASKLRSAASELNSLSMAEEARKQISEGAKETGEVVDFAAERAARLDIEAQTLEQTRSLRENAHQQRLAQIAGNISDEQGLRLQQYDLELAQLQQKNLAEAELRNRKFAEEQNALLEQEALITENKLLKESERFERLAELQAMQDELEASHRLEIESATQAHNDKLADITKRRVEFETQLKEQQRQRDLQGASQFFGNLASLSNTGSKKLFEISKAAAIGQTIVNTYAAAQRAMAEISYPLNIAVAASQIVAGLARVKQISSTKFGSKSASGSAGSGGGAASAGGGGGPGSSSMPAHGNQFEKKQEEAPRWYITIAGDVVGNDAGKLVDEMSRLINEGDKVLIRPDSRNGQELAAASGGN